jgi:hypothetical protein
LTAKDLFTYESIINGCDNVLNKKWLRTSGELRKALNYLRTGSNIIIVLKKEQQLAIEHLLNIVEM